MIGQLDTLPASLHGYRHRINQGIHQPGPISRFRAYAEDYVELHALRLDQVVGVGDGVAVPSDLKIGRCEGDNDAAIHRAIVELAGMCGLELRSKSVGSRSFTVRNRAMRRTQFG